MSARQRRALNGVFKWLSILGIEDRSDRLLICSSIMGISELDSLKEMSAEDLEKLSFGLRSSVRSIRILELSDEIDDYCRDNNILF